MKQADEAIEKVLAGLRASDAPEGMQGRILQAMQARAAADEGDRAGWRMWLRMPALAVYGTVLAGLLVVVAVSMRHQAAPQRVARLELKIKRTADRSDAASGPSAAVVPANVRHRAESSISHEVAARSGGQEVAAYVAPDYEALAVEEMRAPSKPTPALPMTAQEKLFRQVVIGEPSDQLAMLNPEEREKANAKAEDDFKAFFGIRESATSQDPKSPAATSGAPAAKPDGQDVKPDDKSSTLNTQPAAPAEVAK